MSANDSNFRVEQAGASDESIQQVHAKLQASKLPTSNTRFQRFTMSLCLRGYHVSDRDVSDPNRTWWLSAA